MRRLNSKIVIGDYEFKKVVNVGIQSSWELMTDTCFIEVPDRFYKNNKKVVIGDGLFKREDPVTVWLGYDELIKEFEGYISKIIPGEVIRFECEDEMWLLKQKTIRNYSKTNLTLKQLINDIAGDKVRFDVVDANLGQFRIKNVNVVQVLEELKSTYGLTSYIRDGVLKVGLAYYGYGTEYDFGFQKNIISSQLEYKREDDTKIVVKGISIMPDNSKYELYAYKDSNGVIQVTTEAVEGEQRTMPFYNLSLSELKEAIKRELPKFIYTGYKGNFETFGKPSVKHGDVAVLEDKKLERSGKYLIKSVEKSFGQNGYRQIIELDIRI